jgi:type I restriction enzyme S subunit
MLWYYAPATAQKNINLSTLENLQVPYCCLKEQDEIIAAIESRLSVCDKLEQIVDENLAKAQALRQSILKKAFAGKLVPQDPNDEHAEKLLERIKAAKATVVIHTSTARRKRK